MPRPKVKRSARVGVAPARRGPGRPPIHDEAWTKVTVVLFNRQIRYLDRLSASIRANTGAAISRAQLIRAVVDAVGEANVDLTAAPSEAELKMALLARLGASAQAADGPATGRRPSQDA
jgi:hypothetical protein